MNKEFTSAVRTVQRVVSVFDRQTGDFVQMIPLTHFDLEVFQYAFEVPVSDSLMHDFYEIRHEHLYALRHEGILFDLDRYQYFVECAVSE